MRIDSYSFGRIVVEGTLYTSDLIIYPEKVEGTWWRKEGHLLQMEDLKEVIEYGPQTIVIGTGAYGLMRVPPQTEEGLKALGIELIYKPTEEACRFYNEICGSDRVVAGLHLTC